MDRLRPVVLPGRDFFYGADTPEQPEEDDDPKSGPLPPTGPTGPTPAPAIISTPDPSSPIVMTRVVSVAIERRGAPVAS